MPNPSTVNATAVGKEVLRRAYKDALSSSGIKIIDGVANHIYTVLSIIFTEQAGAADELISMVVDIESSGVEIYLLKQQSITARGTFIWNDKIVLAGTDELIVFTEATSNLDCYITYIDQQFAAP